MATGNKSALSKSILEMKFMKRTKEKVEKQMYQEEGEEYFGNHLTPYLKKQTGQFIMEPSFVFCEQLIEGRLSFQGMNPEIERLMEIEESEKLGKIENEKDTEISDSEMADRWKKFKRVKNESPHVKSQHKKWQKKNGDEPIPKKPKFMKPKD